MSSNRGPSAARHLTALGLFLLLGVPLVAYLWETVHQLLALHVDTTRLLISLPALVAFVLLMRFVGRRLSAGEDGD